MCGLAGIINADPSKVRLDTLKRMSDIIAYRGPDGEGQWINDDGKVGLCHRRLSIIDLSTAGCQPMHYMDRYTIIFNGEIYNYIELREKLLIKGYHFNSKTDTEVLMALYHSEGENCLADLDGMFTFIIYDNITKELFCARDRFGEKPFFYAYQPGKHFLFASEMKALWTAGISKDVNNVMLYNYLVNGMLENPADKSQTFYTDCVRLPQAHFIRIDTNSCTILEIKKYWDVDPFIQNFDITEQEATEKFKNLFYNSVERRLRSDVPVGSSLSGGLDSSLVVCQIDEILEKKGGGVQKTFSARFHNHAKDEGRYMQMVIDQTKVDAHFVFPSENDIVAKIDTIMYHQEEPFGSSSIYAQYCVMELAKQQGVTVLLDGQGADEILAGYHGYYYQYFKELKNKFPQKYKPEFNAYQDLHSSNRINGLIKKDLKYFLKTNLPGTIAPLKKFKNYYQHRLNPVISTEFHDGMRNQDFRVNSEFNSLNEMLHYATFKNGLHLLLRYADRNSMAHSREVRLPFLNYELVNFVYSLPPYFKIHNGWTKWIMRETYKNLMPEDICWRTDKIGFETPQKTWLKSDVVTERIMASKKKLVHEGILDKRILKQDSATVKMDKMKDSWPHLMSAYLIK